MEAIAGFNTLQIAAALVATFVSAFVRGLTGFGMAIILVPILALALLPVDAVLVTNFLALFIGGSEILRLIRDAEKSAWVICALVLCFTPPGLWLLTVTGADLARFIIALVAVIAFILILMPQKKDVVYGAGTTRGVGVLSGLMTGFAGMPGPPVVPYYVGQNLSRATTTASMLLIFTVAAASGLLAGAALGELEWRLFGLALALFPAVLIGNWLGAKASGKVSDRAWRICVGLVLGAAAFAALIRLA